MKIEEEPDAYYKAEDGISIFPCSLQQAQLWLIDGFFTSDTQFQLTRGYVEEWTTLGELIKENGRAMPFTEWFLSEEERQKQDEELEKNHLELADLNMRKLEVLTSMQSLQDRLAVVRAERQRIEEKFVNYVQLAVPSGVDPLALLKSCRKARQQLEGDIAEHFKQLRARFDRCDKKELERIACELLNMRVFECVLCSKKLTAANNVITHICTKKHIQAMGGVVCADAFNFWLNAVEEATVVSMRLPPEPVQKSESADRMSIVEESDKNAPENDQKKTELKSSLPSIVNPFALLKSCKKAKRQLKGDIVEHFKQLRARFDRCNKKELVRTASPVKITECILCSSVLDSANNVIAHICTKKHIQAMEGSVCADSFNFWWNAVEEANAPEEHDTKLVIRRPLSSPISAPSGVDPFALLDSCTGARRKLNGSVIKRFRELKERYFLCDQGKLAYYTKSLLKDVKRCFLCDMKVNASSMSYLPHICHWEHIRKLQGAVCADAFDFWWNAVAAATEVEADTQPIREIQEKPKQRPKKIHLPDRIVDTNLTVDQSSNRRGCLQELQMNEQHPQVATQTNLVDEREEKEKRKKKIRNRIITYVGKYDTGNLSLEEAYQKIMTIVGAEKFANPSLQIVFKCYMAAAIKKASSMEGIEVAAKFGYVLAFCLCKKAEEKDIESRNKILKGIANSCKDIVEQEQWEDSPNIWNMVAEVLINAHVPPEGLFTEAHPTLGDFKDAFLNAAKDERKPYTLFVLVLKRLAEVLYKREKDTYLDAASWVLGECESITTHMKTKKLDKALKGTKMEWDKNLLEIMRQD